jgi:phosphoribosylaminoimidazolecarboxamide formyltransferase/IMP cyclohydrolase
LNLTIYKKVKDLKYGQNPHQTGAEIGVRIEVEVPPELMVKDPSDAALREFYNILRSYNESEVEFPVKIVNGNPGTINFMEIFRMWKLVKEMDQTFDMPSSAVSKHKVAAGAALGMPMDNIMKRAYCCEDMELSSLATAAIRANNTDPKSAYGGTQAFSRKVDVKTAEALKPYVLDVIVAPDYEPEALEILRKKKGGKIVIAKFDPNYVPPQTVTVVEDDFVFRYNRNDYKVTDELLEDVIGGSLTDEEKRDLKLGAIISKYTKSNKTVYTLDGQSTGIMPCQQSRVDSMKWAGDKSIMWLFRQTPVASDLKLEGKLYEKFQQQRTAVENMLDTRTGTDEKSRTEKIRELICDALEQRGLGYFRSTTCGFLPFEDCIEEARKRGVNVISYPKAPGKGIRFDDIVKKANELNVKLVLFPYRLFEET